VAARLFRLRLALLGGDFRGSFAKGLRTSLWYLVLAAAAVLLAYLPVRLLPAGEDRALVDIIVGSLVLAAVFLVPFFENRRHLEPRQFAQFPSSPGSIALALLVTSIVSWPFLLLAVWLVALAVLRPEWHEPGWLAPTALVLAAILALCSARLMSAFSKLLAGQRFAGAVRTVGVVLFVAFLPAAVFAGATVFGPDARDAAADAAEVAAWTPFGAPFAALSLAASGDVDGAVLRLAVVAGAILLLVGLWIPVVWVSNQHIERPVDPGAARTGLGWFERFPARPSQVIAARQLTYWARDPRYRDALFAIPIAPIVMLLAFWVAGADLRTLSLVPLPVILLLLGWSQHNDVSMDSTAIWEHVASGIRGRADRAGRLAPVMMLGVPIALIGSSLTVTALGDWRVLPAVLGMNLSVLFVSSAVSSVFSVMMPYPTTRPGDSPFVQPQWAGSGSGVAQTLSMLIALVLVVPPVWFSVIAFIEVGFMENIWALGFGIGYGALALLLGVLIGGWIFDRSGPELIAVTQVFD
jgi:ABC-2 type transport system permease protein